MDGLIRKIEQLALAHDKPAKELIEAKDIKLSLRNSDQTGVVVGITSKGQVIGRDEDKNPTDGRLLYCGYDVSNVVDGLVNGDRFGFDEVTYLLLTGELPTKDSLMEFSASLAERRDLTKREKRLIMQESESPNQMMALAAAVTNLGRFDSNLDDHSNANITRQCIDVIAKFPTIVAYNYNALAFYTEKGGMRDPDKSLSTAENFLYILNGELPNPRIAHILDIALVLHAEHGGGNNSTFNVRSSSSTDNNIYMALSGGIGSLSGTKHGGANECVMHMMSDLKASIPSKRWENKASIKAYLRRILNHKNEEVDKIYGIGHAVYTLSDPRAVIFKRIVEELINGDLIIDNGSREQLKRDFALYQTVAEVACPLLEQEKGKVSAPNVDFYSGLVYTAMGIPTEIFTPLFAMARVAGWSAHSIEQRIQGGLLRPAYASTIEGIKPYMPMQQRTQA